MLTLLSENENTISTVFVITISTGYSKQLLSKNTTGKLKNCSILAKNPESD